MNATEQSLKLTKAEEKLARDWANAQRCPVVVVDGDAPPTAAGERGYSVFRKSGGVCHYPGSARRAGYKTDYTPSTFRVEVGREWVLEQRRRHVRHTLRKKFLPETPNYVLADYLEEQGRDEEAALFRP